MHLSAMPTRYQMDHWPLDRLRSGIGWIGWVPFAVLAGEVPEATKMIPMNGGTCVLGQREIWQVDDPTAIARAQALDLRLNALGVLPTTVELMRGDWGQ